MQGIYCIRHIESGRAYVGSSIDIPRRWKEHRSRLKTGRHPARHLSNAYRVYGENAFEFEVIEECGKELLIEREQFWIELLSADFNVAPVAGSVAGLVRSDEVRARMSAAQKGRPRDYLKGIPRSDAVKAAVSAAQKGKVKTAEHLAKISASLKGRDSPRKGAMLSDDTKAKISAAKAGVKQSADTVKNRSLANTGKKRSEETKKKISSAKKGAIFSDEHKRKLSEAAKLRASRVNMAEPSS